MGILIDIVIIIIGIICIVSGYKRGLTGSIIKIISFILSIVIAFILYKPVSKIVIDNTQLDEVVKENIQKILEDDEQVEENINDNKIDNNNLISMKEIKKDFKNATNEFKDKMIINISNMIINIFIGILVFILSKIILAIIALFIKQLTKFPIIHQADKIGGVIYGGLEWAIIIYTILALIYLISLVYNNEEISEFINSTFIAKVLYNNNIILKFLIK